MENVLYVPDLRQNLFSTAAATSKGYKMVITKDGCKLLTARSTVSAVGVKDEQNQLRMQFRHRIDENANTAAVSLQQWHRRLGHINIEAIKKMCSEKLVDGVNLSNSKKFFCEDCQVGKMTRASHKSTPQRPSKKGEYMHADLCGFMEEDGVGGVRYCLLIKDEATSIRYVYFLKSKDEVFQNLSTFIPLVHNTIGNRIKHFRFDNGLEFVNRDVKNLLSKEGITWEHVSAYTREQNGRIERDNRTIQESARTMLIASGLKKFLWPEAVRTAVYLLNRSTSSKCVGSTPYEKWFGTKPDLSHVKIFGTECFVQIPKQLGREKWDPKAKKVFLVGFEPTAKNFRLFDPSNRKVFISCDVRFNETEPKTFIIEDDDDDNEATEDDVGAGNRRDTHEREDGNEEHEQNQHEATDDQNGDQQRVNAQVIKQEIEDTDTAENERKNKRYNLRSQSQCAESVMATGYSAALESSERDQWQKAIDDELNSLHVNNTWDIVKRPKNVNIVGCRWVFKLKPSSNGTAFKARLVAKGYSQREGVDFHETFSPVVRYDSIRTVLSIAAIEDWEIMQFDVKTAFLNGDLDTTIYMEIPKGVETSNENDVCCLKKSLYGLKQASRVWNEKFTKFLKDFNMVQSKADGCVFRRVINGQTVILLLYVDDGLVLSSSKDGLDQVMAHLSSNFVITKGYENHYVGIEFIRDRANRKIFINQTHYIEKLIKKFEMGDCKKVSTPADSNVVLRKSQDGENEPFPYR